MIWRAVLLAAFLVLSSAIFAQPQLGSRVTQEMRTAANDAYQKQNWPDAVKCSGDHQMRTKERRCTLPPGHLTFEHCKE